MASTSRFSKRAQESVLGRIVDEQLCHGQTGSIHDQGYAIDFIESQQGFGIKLFPAQRVIVKLTFGIPIDYRPQIVPVYDPLKTTLKYELSESDFIKFLYNEGRCNVNDWRDVPPWGFGTTLIVAGRRGGKSQVVSAIAGTMLRNLLSIHSPQDYYNLVPGSPIDFTFLGTDEDSSGRLYEKLRADVNRSPFFTPYIRENTTTEMKFVSESDRFNRDITPSIKAKAYACTTRAVRGPSSYFLALDEFAHFRSTKDANSDTMYEDATPSTGFFPSKEDPDRADSRILVISSPLGRIGKFYELHKQALEQGIASNILTLRLSTAEMNPRFPASKLREAYDKDAEKFDMEYAANFSDGSGSYVPVDKFTICVNNGRQNLTRFSVASVGRKYFWGLDYGTQNDATALAIGHLEMVEAKGVGLIFDYIDRMMVGEPFFGPGVIDGERVATLKELDLVDIVSWLVAMHQVLPCYKGATDQHGGTTLKQLLQINGITKMELVHLTDQINSQMYFALKGYITNGTASFPDVPKFITEFNALEAEFKSKYVLKVEAPQEKGAHDDMADAVALVAWQAQKWLDTEGKLDLDPTGRVLQVSPHISSSTSFIDPNNVSMHDMKVLSRIRRTNEGLMLPPGLPQVRNPWGQRRWR